MSPDSLEIDRAFPGVGRLCRRIDSTSKALRRKYNRMLDALKDDGRTDIIRAIKDGSLEWAEAYGAWVRRRVDTLPVGELAPSLSRMWAAWLKTLKVGDGDGADCSPAHFTMLEQAARYFEREDPKARVADLPALLERLRTGKLGTKHPTSFNHARSAALTFARSKFKRSSALYQEIAAVERRKVRQRDRYQGNALTPAQLEELFPNRTTDAVDAIAWTMATTGMHERELWGDWSAKADRIRVGGTKQPGRMRYVPLVLAPTVPAMHPRTFTDKLRERTNRFIKPYDLRRTYAHAMEEVGITRSRRKAYMGHGADDITALYERHEVAAHLTNDAAKLREYFGVSPGELPGLTLHTAREA